MHCILQKNHEWPLTSERKWGCHKLGLFSNIFRESEEVIESLLCSLIHSKLEYSVNIFLRGWLEGDGDTIPFTTTKISPSISLVTSQESTFHPNSSCTNSALNPRTSNSAVSSPWNTIPQEIEFANFFMSLKPIFTHLILNVAILSILSSYIFLDKKKSPKTAGILDLVVNFF